MQKILIAFAFALAISTAFAGFTANSAWPKTLTQIVQDTDYNFTNVSAASLNLLVTNAGEISLINLNNTAQSTNMSAFGWTAWWKTINSKTLTGGSNTSLAWTAPVPAFIGNGYIVSLGGDNDTGIPLLRAYQQPLAGGAALGRITVGSNANATYMPSVVGAANIGKTIYIFYQAANQKVNVTSFTVGGAASTTEYTITSAYDANTFAGVWGEALSTSQVQAVWSEAGVLKDALIDVTKGTVSANAITGWNTSYSCRPYSTDKKWYGTFCQMMVATTVNGTTTTNLQTYVRNATSALFQLASYNASVNSIYSVEPYGPYLAIFFTNGTTSPKTYSYELWNLDTLTIYNTSTTPSRVTYLTTDVNSTFIQTRLPAGGIYGLVFNNRAMPNATITNVSVGILLGSSYLTTVFGFIMTIIAGLFLF
jgi:hypothetical protein